MATAKMTMKIELYSTTIDPTMPFENVPDDAIDYINEFNFIDEAARYADTIGCGWYLWSTPGRGEYLGTIRVVQGSPAEIHQF